MEANGWLVFMIFCCMAILFTAGIIDDKWHKKTLKKIESDARRREKRRAKKYSSSRKK